MHNPKIVAMHAAVDGKGLGDEVAWCSSFAAWCFQEAGIHVPRGVTRAAQSWKNAQGLDELEQPALGAIAIFARGSESWQGHVGFVLGSRPGLLMVLGGNQRNAVTVEPWPTAKLLALRWPACFARRKPLP